MTLEDYLQRMHDLNLRDHLEKPMKAWDTASVREVHQKEFLEDYSHLNSPHWLKVQAAGHHAKPANRRKPEPPQA